MTIPVTELARRLCVAVHPTLRTTGAIVPCGSHTRSAERLYGLIGPAGEQQLEVVTELATGVGIGELRALLDAIGDAYGAIPAGMPTGAEVDAALPGLYDAIGRALVRVGHPFAPARDDVQPTPEAAPV